VIRTAGPALGLRACLRVGGYGGPLRLVGRWQMNQTVVPAGSLR